MFNAKAKKTRNRISSVNQKDVWNRKRRAMLNWEGSLEERTLLAYNALGPGLVSFFNDIQLPFNEQVTDTEFPVIGNSLSTDTLAYLFNQDSPGYTSLMTKASAIPANLPDETAVITAITDAFGIPPEFVRVEGERIWFLAQAFKSLQDLPFDIGIPALNLSTTGNVNVTLDLTVDFNIDVTDTTFTFITTGDTPEINLTMVPNYADLDAYGKMGPLYVNIKQGVNDWDTLTLNVDIVDATPGGIILSPQIEGHGFGVYSADFEINANFLGFDAGVPTPGLNPTLQTRFEFNWDFASGSPYGTTYTTAIPFITFGSLNASFTDVNLDLGTAIQGLMEPVGEYLDKFAGPFMRIVEPFRKEIPFLKKVDAPSSVQEILTKALIALGDPDALKAAKYLEQLDFLLDLYEAASNATASGVVNLGSVNLAGPGFDIQSPTASLANLDLSSINTNPITSAYETAKSLVANGFLEELQALDIDMPIFPTTGDFLEPFKMLLGQPADLVKFTTSFNVGTPENPERIELFDFPFMIGPVPAQVTGDFDYSFSGNMVFGLDTSGIIAGENPANGFYLQTPQDKPLFELITGANLRAGVGNRSFARIGVEGGLYSNLKATLGSGNKIYFPELENLLNSGCAIELEGTIYFQIGGFIEYVDGYDLLRGKPTYGEFRYPVSRFDIYNWDVTCDPNVRESGVPPQPVLAEVIDGTLFLNMGPRAPLRGQYTDVINEEFAVAPLDELNPTNGSVVVTAFGYSQTYTGVARVFADGGDGDDVIQLLEIPFLSTILGGTGNDNLKVSLGASVIDGGDGNDSIFGGIGNDAIFGGLGNDYILLGWGEDTVYAGLGDDYITTEVQVPIDPKNKNNKYIDGGKGNDQLYGGDGDDTIFGQSGMDTFGGGTGTDRLIGGDDHDTFVYLSDYKNQTIDGGSGQNEFVFIGNDASDLISFAANVGQVIMAKATGGSAAVEMTSITDLSINPGDGGDSVDIQDLSGTTVNNAAVFLGLSPEQVGNTPPPQIMNPDNFQDLVAISGSNLNDIIHIVPIEAPTDPVLHGTLQVSGTPVLSTISTSNLLDKLTVNGLAGDDQISSLPSVLLTPTVKPDALIRILLDGGTGDDVLSADATLIGGTGNDTFIVPDGVNTVIGGTGIDTILVEGTDIADSFTVGQTQLNPTQSRVVISGPNGTSDNTVEEVELIKILGRDGGDTITMGGSGAVIPYAIFGGFGNDIISGQGFPAFPVDAAAVIEANGEQGNDTIQGGSAADQLFGGDGADLFLWNAGDNSDLIDGGTGSDATVFTGTDGTDCFHVASDDMLTNLVRVDVNASGGPLFDGSILAADVEHVSLQGGLGDDLYEIAPLALTPVKLLDIDYGATGNDVAKLNLPIEGAGITVTPTLSAASAQINGLKEMIRFFNATSADTLLVEGSLSDDIVIVYPEVLATMSVVVDGNNGDDYINGATTAMGGAGDDTIIGTVFGDLLLGGLGNDSIDGLAGDDLILGDADGTGAGSVNITCDGGLTPSMPAFAISAYTPEGGSDTIRGGEGNDSLNGGGADDEIYGEVGEDLIGLLALGSNPWLPTGFDEPGDDLIWGGIGADTIDASAGNDEIYGDAGADLIRGGQDADMIWGGDDIDVIYGNLGNDTVHGDAGDDTIYGNEDDDVLYGDAGTDMIYGNDGNDSIAGGADSDTVYGGLGSDVIHGDEGDDILSGGPAASEGTEPMLDGNDTMFGGAGIDVVNGDYGNDFINGGEGNDQLWGAEGDDVIGVFDFMGETYLEPGNDSMMGGNGNDAIRGAITDSSGNLVDDGNDIIFGEDGNDTLWGGAGGDMIYGGLGDDFMLGGTPLTANTLHKPRKVNLPNDGNDTMLGGDGFDQVDGGNDNNLLDAGNDGIRETVLGGTGNDMAYSHQIVDRRNYDRMALDGGYNHVFCRGGLLEPIVPTATTSYITWTIAPEYSTGQKYQSDGSIILHPPLSRRTSPNNGPNGPIRKVSPAITIPGQAKRTRLAKRNR